jgi:hypothetical protein
LQDELHDSIEDAKTAYALFVLYENVIRLHGTEGITGILLLEYAVIADRKIVLFSYTL